MRLATAKFTVRRMMVAVVVVTVVVAVERLLFHWAIWLVMSSESEGSIWEEAATVWVILNIALSLVIGISAAIVRAAKADMRDRVYVRGALTDPDRERGP